MRREVRRRLLAWYSAKRRSLPWRGEGDPYRVWVSEIMLQQTRVNAVLAHYQRFLERFPSVEALARARLPAVLAAWSGLGYYRRARALHEAARRVTRSGAFPRAAEQWRELPGVGRYTAAAIASIAFGEPCAVVDGNVERVLGRMLGVSRRQAWDAAGALLSRRRPGDFNQAMMELGATVCLAREPRCGECPVYRWCGSRGPRERSSVAPRQKRRIAFSLLRRGQAVRLVRRPQSLSLMPGMWELPPHPGDGAAPLLELRHAITVTDYRVRVYAGCHADGLPGAWVAVSRLERLPLTGLARKILRRAGII